jgi:pyruvate/2-oxoglutarate dehydrogenase complex dihydrolipoamide dehydrogenase (E3) component
LISVGFAPDITLAENAKLEIGRHNGIKTDRYLKTSNTYIYSVGDNTEVINAVASKPDFIPLATHAYTLGHIAGENAAGGNIRYEPVVKNISVKLNCLISFLQWWA